MKKLFTLVFSLSVMAISYATNYTATQAGNWSDALTWGNVGVPASGDNVSTNGFAVTVDADATCDNLTLLVAATGSSIANQLKVNAGFTLTVRGKIDGSIAPAASTTHVLYDATGTGTIKLTGASLIESPYILIGNNAIGFSTTTSGMFKPYNLVIEPANTANTYQFGTSSVNYVHGAGTFTVKANTKLDIKTVCQLGQAVGNELIIEEGAVVNTTNHFKGTSGNNARITKATINGSLTCGDFSQLIATTLVLGNNATLKTSNSAQTNAAVLAWDGWWGAKTLSATPVVADFGTPATITMGTNTTIEFGKSGNQNINGIVPANGTNPTTSYSISYANLKISGSGTKTIQSNLSAAGSLVVNPGCTLALASGVTASFGGMLVNLGTTSGVTVASHTITGSANNTLYGKLDGSVSGTSVTLVATPLAGYQFVNWTEGGNEVSNSATYTFTASGNSTLVANFSVITGLKNTDNDTFVTVIGNDLQFSKNVNSVEVYTLQGQLVKVMNNAVNHTVEKSGVYILKMHTVGGVRVQKVIVN